MIKPQKSIVYLMRIGLVVLLIASCLGIGTASATCGTVHAGQTVDISGCVSPGDSIGWWVSAADRDDTLPSMTVTVLAPESFYADMFGYYGPWYVVDRVTGTASTKAFILKAPKLK